MRELIFLVSTEGKTKKQIISRILGIMRRKKIIIPTPTACHLWRDAYVKKYKDIFTDLEQVFVYKEDSHLIRRLLRCKDCGQLYFYEFYEEIDWDNGNDPQYRKWIPVQSEADARILSKVSIYEIFEYLPQLQSNSYGDEKGYVFERVGKNS